MSAPEMTERGKEFMLKLANLLEEYEADIFYDIYDEGLHFVVEGKEIFVGDGDEIQEGRFS